MKVNGPVLTVDTDQTEKVTLALAGIHVVWAHVGHPGLIWATFTHENEYSNDCVRANSSCRLSPGPPKPQMPPPPPPTPVPCTTSQQPTYTFVKPSKLDVNGSTTYKPSELHQANLRTTSVCRAYSHGGAPATHKSNIDALNAVMAQWLPAPWKHYKLRGAVWTLPGDETRPVATGEEQVTVDGNMVSVSYEQFENQTEVCTHPGEGPCNPPTLTPDFFTDSSQVAGTIYRGGVFLANTTMETFHQNVSCFKCHTVNNDPSSPKSKWPIYESKRSIGLSHMFNKYILYGR